MSAALERREAGVAAGIAAALALAAAYLATAPLNRTEAEDVWDFAWQVERAAGPQLVHPHHLVHLPLMRALWRTARWVAPDARAHGVMAGVGALAAGAAVVLFGALLRRAGGVSAPRAAAAAAVLAVSYGIWRYAAEAEAYAPAAALALGAWWSAAGARRIARRIAAVGLGVGAIWMHIFSALPVLGAIPLWLWRRHGLRAAIAHGAVTAAATALGYAAAGQVPIHTVGGSDPLRAEGGLRPESVAKAALAFGSTVVAANFVFGEPAWVGAIERWFPARMIEEEAFLGRAIPPAQRRAAWGTLALVALVAAAVGAALRCRPTTTGLPASSSAAVATSRAPPRARDLQGLEANGRGASKDWTALALAAAAWFAAHAILLLAMEPGNPELWVMSLPPFWMAVGAAAEGRAVRPALLATLAGALGAHNWLGGLEPLRRPEGDVHRARAASVLRVCTDRDTLLTAGGTVWARYLRYHAPSGAVVVDLWRDAPPDSPRPGGRMLATGDLFDLPRAWRTRFPARARQIEAWADGWRPRARRLIHDPWGGVWDLSERTSPPRGKSGGANRADLRAE